MIRITLALVAALFIVPQLVSADVNYTQRYLSPEQAISRTPESRVFFKSNARLVEDWRYYGTNYMREQRLTLFAEKKEIVMDTVLKIYKVVPLDIPVKPDGDKATVTVKDLGEETVLGFKARHYLVDIHYDYKNASADADREIRQELWIVPSTTLKAYPTVVLPIDLDAIILGDKEAYIQAMQGLHIRERVFVPSKGNPQQYREVYSTEVSSLSTKQLDDAYFKIPDGYKEVTADEYRKAQNVLSEQRMDIF